MYDVKSTVRILFTRITLWTLLTFGEEYDDSTLMRVLSTIERFSQLIKRARMEDLERAINVNMSRLHLEFCIVILLDKGHIDKIRASELYPIYEYSITAQGINYLRMYKEQALAFAHTAKRLAHCKNRRALYDLLTENRNMLWFAYYDGMLSKKDLDSITKVLDMEMKHFFWDKKSEFWKDLFWEGYGVN